MRYLSRLSRWVWRAWPLLVLLCAMAAHAVLLLALSGYVPIAATNKVVGAALQIGGGLIVLHAIDGTLGLFRRQNLLSALSGWLKEFPRPRQDFTLHAEVGLAATLGVAGDLSIRRNPTTLEERIVELERRVVESDARIQRYREDAEKHLSELRGEFAASLDQVDSRLRELTGRVERAAIGGLKQQLFGVMLAIYGAVVTVFA